jgi:pimeloyl-ACP methyl ester carboxylesterase
MKHRLSFHYPTSIQPDNPLFVFLPGMDGTGKLYQRQAHYLTKWFDIRCLVIPPDDLSHWELLTEQVICLIEGELRRKSVSSVYLCGESFGGCLGLKVALATPSWLDKLILVNPASCFNQRPWLGWGIPFTQVMPDFLYSTSTLGLLPI